ncbi:hypothetical protein ACFU5O_14950 [Streptomyces sp. NPDC057445]|uniref:hypothetical protein n=1 Tax=Streptomyces sp. NPDC057445 TaxID=3346136 RepID=UPI00369DEF66
MKSRRDPALTVHPAPPPPTRSSNRERTWATTPRRQARALRPGLALRPGRQLVIDLARLTFCDTSGITVPIAARNHALGAVQVQRVAATLGQADDESAAPAPCR